MKFQPAAQVLSYNPENNEMQCMGSIKLEQLLLFLVSSVLSVRLREGYSIQDVSIAKGTIYILYEDVSINHLHPNISMHILDTFSKVLTRRAN